MWVGRRKFLANSLVGVAGLAAGRATATNATNKLSLYHIHTTESLMVAYRENGTLVDGALEEINHLLRDFRNGQTHAIDVALLDTLSALSDEFGGRGHYEIISGYRSPRTNAALRRVTTGVAEDSYHLEGRAVDVRFVGATTADLHTAALDLQHGGVGYYPESNFVHLDTGAVRNW